jgi:hypothetical protein
VDLDKLSQGDCNYKINGQHCQREEIVQALQKSNLADDSAKLRLVIIGPDAARKKVLDDLHNNPALAQLTRDYIIQDYPPDHWHVKDAGFKTDGQPSIYLQAPEPDGKGKVLHRQDDYAGPDQLATALRRADPNYTPAADPNLTRQTITWKELQTLLQSVPLPLWLLVGVVLYFIYKHNTKGK